MNRQQRRKVGFNTGPEPQVRRIYRKVHRNELCPCNSGKKFKNCSCYNEDKSYYDFNKEVDNGNNGQE